MVVLSTLFAFTAVSLVDLASAERVLGSYIFQRHGDRTPKSLPPTQLTDLGYSQGYMTGDFFRDRYISSNSADHIEGISPDFVHLSQVTASAPQDNVIENSGQAFLQGLYPPVGPAARETLRNGTTILAPMSGYQLIPMSEVKSGSGSEDSAWLQSTSSCNNAKVSSNNYFYSTTYQQLLSSTGQLYQSLAPLASGVFSSSQMSFKNAFTIWDLFNVALIHNSTASFPASNTLSDQVMHELLALANAHEFNLAYNSTDRIRAVAGMTLAGRVLSALNRTITSGGKSKLNIEFGAYATFLSYFGLAGLSDANVNFTGMPTYASSMAWELVTNASGLGIPPVSQISVRFLFHNGTSIAGSTQLTSYPLFGQPSLEMGWPQFVNYTKQIAITSQGQWCQACGNTTGMCSSTTFAHESIVSKPKGMSLAVAGVIGAMVTLGVLATVTALIMLAFGLRLVRKKTLAPMQQGSEPSISTSGTKSA